MDVHDGPHVSFVVTAPGADKLPWDEMCVAGAPRARWDCRVSLLGRRAARLARASRGQLVAATAGCATTARAGVRPAGAPDRARLGAAGAGRVARARRRQREGPRRRAASASVRCSPTGRGMAAGLWRRARLRTGGSTVSRRVYANGRSTGRYLAGYFVDDPTSRKASLLESVRQATWTPKRAVWPSPQLTRVSGVTMRVLRLSRRWWAARRGLCSYPSTHRYSPAELNMVWRLLGG